MRGPTVVVVITPNVLGDATFEAGLLNCGWLNALKNSERNSRYACSLMPPTSVRLVIAMSQFFLGRAKQDPTPGIAVTSGSASPVDLSYDGNGAERAGTMRRGFFSGA